MVVVIENLECDTREEWFRPTAWHPMNDRDLNEDEKLVLRILNKHEVPCTHEDQLWPVGFVYHLPDEAPLGRIMPRGMCPDVHILGDDRYAEQFLEITMAKKSAARLKRRRIDATRERYPGVIITLIDRTELGRIRQNHKYLLKLLVPAEPVALAA